ncbi:MAG: hypothetical protein QW275_01930 [Candidatus Anstonellaceae archaeon]
MGKYLGWIAEKSIYLFVIVLLFLIVFVILLFQQGLIDADSARVYLQAWTGIATLALLYFAYFNIISKREEDTARLELAVRPILVWELQSPNKSSAIISYRAIKHPIYDFQATIRLNDEQIRIDERHLDVSEVHPEAERRVDLTDFIFKGLQNKEMGLMKIDFAYYSEVGGKYEFSFTKEVIKRKGKLFFKHRKIISAKYPWKKEAVVF